MKALGERTHFDISGHFVITELDIEGVYCIPAERENFYRNKLVAL